MNTKSNVNPSRVWLALAALGLFTSVAGAQESASDLWRKALSHSAQISDSVPEASRETAEPAKAKPADATAPARSETAAPADTKALSTTRDPASKETKTLAPLVTQAEKAGEPAKEPRSPVPAQPQAKPSTPASAETPEVKVAPAAAESHTDTSIKGGRYDGPRVLAKKLPSESSTGEKSPAEPSAGGKSAAKKGGKSAKGAPAVSVPAAQKEAVAVDKPAADKADPAEKAGKAPKATDLFVLPYQPGEGAQLAMQATEAWVEVYAVEAKDAKKALQTLLSQDTPPALGVVADDTFYAATAQGEFEGGLAGYQVSRGGKALSYDVDCAAVPQKGDELRADFTSGPWQVRLQGKVTAHFVFGAKNIFSDEIVRLPGLTPENCYLVDEQRLVYQGTLTLSRDGKPVSSRDVVFQSITPQ